MFDVTKFKNHTLGMRLELAIWLREGITNAILRSHHRDDRNFWPVRKYVVWFANRT